MHISEYLELARSSEKQLAEAFMKVAKHHSEEPDIYFMCEQLSSWSEDHVKKLEPFIKKYSPSIKQQGTRTAQQGIVPAATKGRDQAAARPPRSMASYKGDRDHPGCPVTGCDVASRQGA